MTLDASFEIVSVTFRLPSTVTMPHCSSTASKLMGMVLEPLMGALSRPMPATILVTTGSPQGARATMTLSRKPSFLACLIPVRHRFALLVFNADPPDFLLTTRFSKPFPIPLVDAWANDFYSEAYSAFPKVTTVARNPKSQWVKQ